jgi:molybdate transport system substrate-binding protein
MLGKARFLLLLLLLAASAAAAGEIRLFAAASLADVVGEIGAVYRREHPEVTLVRSFAASGTLARQIAAGAPADLFISADPQWIAYLATAKQVAPGEVATLAYNALVFIGRPDLQVASLADLAGLRRIAMGSPGSVPAGQYAAEALKKAGLYDRLAAERRLVLAKDARQAFIYAERGEVDGAFVYATDVPLAKYAIRLFAVPPELHSRIAYPMALTAAGRTNPEAQDFFAFLQSPQARAILSRYGFSVE